MPRTARARAPLEAKQAAAALPSIASFARVYKSHTLPDASAKKAVVSADLTTATPTTASKKRKASAPLQHTEPAGTAYNRRNISYSPSDDDEDEHIDVSQRPKRACRRTEAPKPSPIRTTKAQAADTAVATPPSAARLKPVAKHATHNHHRPTATTIIAKSRQAAKTGQTKIDAFYAKQQQGKSAATARADAEIDASFPSHLAELVRLHKAFLAAVVMQLAHSRSAVPLDLRELTPNISRSWRKREVTVEDVRRCVAIESSSRDESVKSPFIVADYGNGRVCVELRAGYEGRAIDQLQLCRQFEDNLKSLCKERATDQMADDDDDAAMDVALNGLSLQELPQADLTDMNTRARTAPLLAKGRAALAEMKSGMVAKQQEMEAKQQAAAMPLLNPDGSKMSLLDRLRHKQLAAANAPLPPSGPELQRRAALNRVADVASTISMLSLSTPVSLPRQAFAMNAIIEKLRDSLRVPVSRDEGVDCIRLIAKEIAPEWIRIVTIGGRDNVVIQRAGEPVSRVIEERVRKLM